MCIFDKHKLTYGAQLCLWPTLVRAQTVRTFSRASQGLMGLAVSFGSGRKTGQLIGGLLNVLQAPNSSSQRYLAHGSTTSTRELQRRQVIVRV